MTPNEYQRLAFRTVNTDSNQTVKEMFTNAALGMAGEAGEVCEVIKKVYFQGHMIDYNHLVEEVGDVLWYAALMTTALGDNLEHVMQVNIDKLKKRYPDKFTVENSVNRDTE